jgi:hypothetical protein
MKYFIFLVLVLSFQNSQAQIMNMPGKELRDSSKLEVKYECDVGYGVKLFFNQKPIVLNNYDGNSCDTNYKILSDQVEEARKKGKKMLVDIDKMGHTKISISNENNDSQLSQIKPDTSISNKSKAAR